MKPTFFKGVVLGSVVSVSIVTATAALAGSGVGAVFNLGKTNTVGSMSALTGNPASKNLSITNSGTGSALGLRVAAGKPPLVVNSDAGKATNLNADKLDGIDSSQFQSRTDWAVVKADGTLARGSAGVTSAKLGGAGTGRYTVDFGHSVNTCARIAALGVSDTGATFSGVIATANSIVSARTVFVHTRSDAGADLDLAFHIEAVC